MEVKPEFKSKVKPEMKQKKSKTKKKQLNLLVSSDEELVDTSKDLYNTKLNHILNQRRIKALEILKHSNDNDLSEDVFNDKTSDFETKSKNKDIDEVMSLLEDIKKSSNTSIKEDNNVDNDSIVEVSDEPFAIDEPTPVSANTRSSTCRGRGRGRGRGGKKASKKKVTRRNSGKKSAEFDPQKAFEQLEGLQAMDDIEVVEDFNTSLNVSQEIDDYIKGRDIEIKVKYKAVVERFVIKSTEKFSKIMPIIADKFKEKVSEMIFGLNEQMIDSDSTPQSIGLTISDIIVCHKRVGNKSVNNDFKDPNSVSLKLRDKTMKSAETMIINKFAKIQVLVDLFSTFKGLPSNKFRLKFDGERLDPNSTVAEADIEDDSQIDVILL